MQHPVKGSNESIKKPQLIAPVNALDQETADTLHGNQKVLLDNIVGFTELTLSVKRDMKKVIEEEVRKVVGDKIDMMEGILTEIIIQKKILQDKGLITREEINKKYEELKKK
jgi:hypothetical protein